MSAAAAATLVEGFVRRFAEAEGFTDGQRRDVYDVLLDAALEADWSGDVVDLKGLDRVFDRIVQR